MAYISFYYGPDLSAAEQFQQITVALNDVLSLVSGAGIRIHTEQPVSPAVPPNVQNGSIWVDSLGVMYKYSGGVASPI